jgi:putative membrane protein
MWHAGDGMGWWMLWGGLMMVLFWGAIIALIVWAVQAVGRREPSQTHVPQTGSPTRTALDIVKERYAHGEISREEFEQIRRDLEQT